jgi:CRISPR/Cas system-associated protein Cas10 (large subunit of type III CRISPR-Cas system)
MSLILKYGFEKNNYSLSRILTFSRLLDLFFGYRLQKFLEEEFENVYTIYSG